MNARVLFCLPCVPKVYVLLLQEARNNSQRRGTAGGKGEGRAAEEESHRTGGGAKRDTEKTTGQGSLCRIVCMWESFKYKYIF